MAKNERKPSSERLKTFEEFIRQLLAKNFDQKIDAENLRNAAEKLSDALPRQKEAA